MNSESLLAIWAVFLIVAAILSFVADSKTISDWISAAIYRRSADSKSFASSAASDFAAPSTKNSVIVLATFIGPEILDEAKEFLSHPGVSHAIGGAVNSVVDSHETLSIFADTGLDHSLFDSLPSGDEIPTEVLDWIL